MGFIVAPARKAEARQFLAGEMSRAAGRAADEPAVRDGAGGVRLRHQPERHDCGVALRPETLCCRGATTRCSCPRWLREDPRACPRPSGPSSTASARPPAASPELSGLVESLFDRMLPSATDRGRTEGGNLSELLAANGFDREQHERIRDNLRRGLIGLAQNRCPPPPSIEDVRPGDVIDARARSRRASSSDDGRQALAAGEVAVVTLAAGAGSRWTQGAGVVKALHPFARLRGAAPHLPGSASGQEPASREAVRGRGAARLHHRLLDARPDRRAPRADRAATATPARCGSRRGCRWACGSCRWCATCASPGRRPPTRCSTSRSRRSARVPTRRSSAGRKAAGEGSDYTDNEPLQCLHPVGHWYEVPNLLRNGVLRDLLAERPRSEAPARPQHRHARRRPRSGPAGAAHRIGPAADLRGDRPADRRSRRRAGPRGWQGPHSRRAGDAARGGGVRPLLLQLAHDLGGHRRAAATSSA